MFVYPSQCNGIIVYIINALVLPFSKANPESTLTRSDAYSMIVYMYTVHCIHVQFISESITLNIHVEPSVT